MPGFFENLRERWNRSTAPSQQNAEASPTAKQEENHIWISRNLSTILFVTIVLCVAGIYSTFSVPISVFPETDFPRVVIGVDNGVMPVEQMQVTITKPIEDAVNSVPGLQTVRSTTSRGQAEVSLFFDWNEDMFHTLQLVDAALGKVQQELPPTARLTTNRLTFATFPILGYSLTSNTVSQERLWEIATYDLKPPLNRLPGVSTVVVQGGDVPEFHIVPDPAKLISTGVTITDLSDAVKKSNVIDSPGLYEANHQLVLGLVGGQVHDAAGLAAVAVKITTAGVPVHIGDVASVQQAAQPKYTIVTANGKSAVLINIARQPSSNTVAVADEVAAEMAVLKRNLPRGVDVQPFYDQSSLVREAIKSVRDAIVIGLVLATIIIVLFLRDWRSSLVAGLVIPVTLLVTILFLRFTGQSFNLMTLGGLAAAIGLVIDDAIVVVENIVLHRDSGQGRIEAVRSAIREITVPLIGSTITPIVVFLPLIGVTGVTGSFFRALALTMTVSLLTSLALALTWTPSLSLIILRARPQRKDVSSDEDPHGHGPWMGKVIAWHRRALELALRFPARLLLICGGMVLLGIIGYAKLGTDQLPEMDEGGFILDYTMPAGSSLSETDRVLRHVEEILKAAPEVESTSRRTGLQMGLAAVTEANYGDFTVKLKDKRSRGIDEIMADIREEILKTEPELDVEFTQVLQDMINDLANAPEPIYIKVFNPDPAILSQVAPRIADTIKAVPGVVDVLNGVDNTISGPATNFQVNPAAAARMGFTAEEVSTDAAAIIEGVNTETPIIQNARPYAVRIRYAAEHRANFDAITNTIINSSTGKIATLGSVATVQQLPPQNEIRRENLQREVNVTAKLEGSDLGGAIKRVQTAVAGLHLPPNIRLQYGGTYEEQQKSFRELFQVLLLSLALVFAVLLTEFRDFWAPTAILMSSALSVIGVIVALLITGTTFNVSSFMGLIMVIGIVAKNGILLIDADQRFRREGMSPYDAMVNASKRRLRPIAMTALAATTGMLPLAFALGAGSQMLQPLAIAVIGGITISLFLSLIVTPTMYFLLTRHKAH
ncbi:acriflavin resistance protein [Candidatus Koribacter versatilis Ellin345]|uniref:Acriflavin resistance protein n=1 Tax=Koribacter versatilis (strain Ellin345) TaxID=204669 RepID=Q1IUY8_KORVE|nr:efflux RND transporter permease subunit [Candidatus Koribacter versatilis]ABF39312.1 acriflavin resistance protein [Candidatus Koribacter versatilis Ellin345]